jgi:hypothetical protein
MLYVVICLLFSHSYRSTPNEFKVIRHKSIFKCLDNMLLHVGSDFSHAVPLCPPFLYIQHFFPLLGLFLFSENGDSIYSYLWTPLYSHWTIRHETPGGCHLHCYCRVNLKSHMTEMKCWSKWMDFVRNGYVTGFQAQYWEEEVISKRTVEINEVGNVGNVI